MVMQMGIRTSRTMLNTLGRDLKSSVGAALASFRFTLTYVTISFTSERIFSTTHHVLRAKYVTQIMLTKRVCSPNKSTPPPHRHH